MDSIGEIACGGWPRGRSGGKIDWSSEAAVGVGGWEAFADCGSLGIGSRVGARELAVPARVAPGRGMNVSSASASEGVPELQGIPGFSRVARGGVQCQF